MFENFAPGKSVADEARLEQMRAAARGAAAPQAAQQIARELLAVART